MQIEKAKEILNSYLDYPELDDIEIMNTAIDTVLNELEKKDKIINEMAEYLDKEDITETFCEGKLDVECVSECRSCIIEYFTNKVEKEGK